MFGASKCSIKCLFKEQIRESNITPMLLDWTSEYLMESWYGKDWERTEFHIVTLEMLSRYFGRDKK